MIIRKEIVAIHGLEMKVLRQEGWYEFASAQFYWVVKISIHKELK